MVKFKMEKKTLDKRKLFLKIFFLPVPLWIFWDGMSSILKLNSTFSWLLVSAFLIFFFFAFLGWWLSYWPVYKLFSKINYYGLKKPKTYEKNLRHFVIVMISLSVFSWLGVILFYDLLSSQGTPLYLSIPISIVDLIALIGLYKLKRWGLNLFMSELIVSLILALYFQPSLYGLWGGAGALLSFIYYPYIRRSVLK